MNATEAMQTELVRNLNQIAFFEIDFFVSDVEKAIRKTFGATTLII
jgi:hypothetical protein